MIRKVLIVTAAVVAAVIFFLLVTLPPSPRTATWTGESAIERRTIAGAYHIHTTRSDGSGDRDAVAAAAARAGLQFVVITDHGDATRTPDPPAYLHGVLCVDGVEISTNGGHYVALGIGAAPYPLGGEPDTVVEDVTRLGGFGFAAHPDSPRAELAWADRNAPVDGIEWLNADTEWRNETRTRLARVLFDYFVRPGPALASMLDRPDATLMRWDALTVTRPVVAIAGHDAHGGMGRAAEDGRRSVLPGVPSYEASFRSFTTRVILEKPPGGDAGDDARLLLEAIRAGRVFTLIDAIAGPAFIDLRGFVETAGGERLVTEMGGALPAGRPGGISVKVSMPAGGELVTFRNGSVIDTRTGGDYLIPFDAATSGAFRAEVRVPGAPGTPPIPWLLSNPIYVLPPPEIAAPRRDAELVPLPRDVSWHIEKDRGSTGSIIPSPAEIALYYRLRPGSRASQFVALVANLPRQSVDDTGSAAALDRIRFTAQAGKPVRVSVQLRYPRGGGTRWARSIYLDAVPRAISIRLADLLPADRQRGPAPAVASASSLLFVVDLTNAHPGDANTIRISRAGFSH